MAGNPLERLHQLLTKYTAFTTIPDIEHYRRIVTPVSGHCMFLGCTEPVTWEDARGGNFLCEGHYLTMKKWITGARSGFFP